MRHIFLSACVLSATAACSDSSSIVGRRDATVVTDVAIDMPIDTPPIDVPDAPPPDVMPPMDVAPDGPPMPRARVVAECGTVCIRPIDAVPNSLGTAVFFTAYTPMGVAAVFRVSIPPAGAPPAVPVLLSASGFEYPAGIAISNNDSNLYVADPSTSRGTVDGIGAVLTLSAAGGPASALMLPPEFVNPGAVSISVDGMELLLTARRLTDSTIERVALRMPRAGGTPTVISTDLVDPSGISEAAMGSVLAYDTRRVGPRSGSTVSFMGMTVTATASNLVVGYPAGLAHALDGRGVLIAGADPAGGGGVLTWIGSDGMATSPSTLSAGMDTPQGLHRARNINLWAIADSSAGANGSIFVVTMP